MGVVLGAAGKVGEVGNYYWGAVGMGLAAAVKD